MSIHQAFSLLKKSPLSRQVLVLSHVYLASFYSLLISFLRGSVSCLHAGKKWGEKRAPKKSGRTKLCCKKAIQVFCSGWRAGRPWEDITATFWICISLMSHLIAPLEQKGRRSQLFAVRQHTTAAAAAVESCLQGCRLFGELRGSEIQGRLEISRQRANVVRGVRDLSPSLDAGHNFCRLNCAPAFCLFAMPCSTGCVIYRPGPLSCHVRAVQTSSWAREQ